MLDVSGTVPFYDVKLCNAVAVLPNVDLTLAMPLQTRKDYLWQSSPVSFKTTFLIPKLQFLLKLPSVLLVPYKCMRVLLNYILVFLHLIFHRYDVVHIQWLPFVKHISIEYIFLRLYKAAAPKAKFVFTMHNMFPHDCKNKSAYQRRFNHHIKYFDAFIVHTQQSQSDFHQIYGVPLDRIFVVWIGMFEADLSVCTPLPDTDKFRIVHFGNLTPYKGTDVLLNALQQLPNNYKNQLEIILLGVIQGGYKQELISISEGLNIKWFPYSVSDSMLWSHLHVADLIVFPYRAISQSGALLLGLFFEKRLLTSDLPAFKETLEGFHDHWFFKSEDVQDLADKIVKHIDGVIPQNGMFGIIKTLKQKYSWEQSAKDTIAVYREC